MFLYIIVGILLLLILLTAYTYYTTKDKIKEAFQIIDNMDTSNMNLNALIDLASKTNIADISGITVDISNVNMRELAAQLETVINSAPTADNRPITDKQRQCDTLRNSLIINQNSMAQRGNVGDLIGMQQTSKIMESINKQLSDLGC